MSRTATRRTMGEWHGVKSAAWCVLFTLILGSFASFRALCCEAQTAKTSSCCSSVMEMAGPMVHAAVSAKPVFGGMEMESPSSAVDGQNLMVQPVRCESTLVRESTEIAGLTEAASLNDLYSATRVRDTSLSPQSTGRAGILTFGLLRQGRLLSRAAHSTIWSGRPLVSLRI